MASRDPAQVARPEVYNVQAMPPQPKVLKPGQLPEARIREFFDKGYILVEDFFHVHELDECLEAIDKIVDRVANRIYNCGKLKDLHQDKNVLERLARLEEEFPRANILVHKNGQLPEAFRKLWANDRLLNLMEQILGPKVCANPVWNIRPKSPGNPDCEVPWHQDSGYFDPASYGTMTPVSWIPLLDVNANNGCMQILEGGHRRGVISEHLNCHGQTWQAMMHEGKLEETLGVSLDRDVKTMAMKKGSLLLFTNLTPHRSLPNKDVMCRWSLDLRFQRPGEPEGLYGKITPVLLRDASNPNLTPDWSPFLVNRHNEQCNLTTGDGADRTDTLNTLVIGPWMRKWPLANSNRHTEAAGLTLTVGSR